MEQEPIILVTGATGGQGGSVAYALLKENKFAVRALVNNINSDKAKDLASAGAEIIEGTLDDIESLKMAMEGCYGVFGVTDYWEHFEKEYNHGKNLIDAVRHSGIQHFIFSSSRNYNKLSNGALSVPHLDTMYDLQEYTISQKIPATFVHIAYFYENFLSYFPPQKGDDGNYYFGLPQGDTKLSMVSVEDLGGVVVPIFDYPDEFIGRIVGIVGEDRSCKEYAEIMSKVLNQNIQYNYIPRETFASFELPWAEELANMFEVQRLYVPTRRHHLLETYGLNPTTQSFETWLTKNKEKFTYTWTKEAGAVISSEADFTI